MSDPQQYSKAGADAFARRVSYLYESMREEFGAECAWQFVLSFYKGAGLK